MKIKGRTILLVLLASALVLTACSSKGKEMPTVVLPAGLAYAEGQDIYFIHTEASDPGIAQLLSEMMSSPVLFVPSLVEIPAVSLANVYVFDNGIEGKGPLGYQPDVFDNPPGSPGYSPLRSITMVTWLDPGKIRELKSAAEVIAAQEAGEVSFKQPGVVVNMPFVVWDGGKR
jgi:hypothetical protein